MSFKELSDSSVALKKKEVKITLKDGRELSFTANEVNFLDRLELGLLHGTNVHANLIAMSIVDENGDKMTPEQASNLSSEHQEIFYRAAVSVNARDKEAKKKTDAS